MIGRERKQARRMTVQAGSQGRPEGRQAGKRIEQTSRIAGQVGSQDRLVVPGG